jgi:hypothetical protein
MAATATTKATAVETATAMEASAVSAMSSLSAVFRPNSANGDNDGENDRKERFHVTKVFVAHRSRAFTRLSSGLRGGSPIQAQQRHSTFSSACTTKRFPSRCASAIQIVNQFFVQTAK